MPICQNCQRKWRWFEAVKKSLTMSISMTCPYCKKEQYYSAKYRKRNGLVMMIVIAIMMAANFLLGPSKAILIIIFSLFPLFLCLNPFFIELSNEEEPLF